MRPDRLITELENALDGPEDVAQFGVLNQEGYRQEGEEVVACRPNFVCHKLS